MVIVTLARKPPSAPVRMALRHHTGLQVDATRVPWASESDVWAAGTGGHLMYKGYMDGSGQVYKGSDHYEPSRCTSEPHPGGRWPANVILMGLDDSPLARYVRSVSPAHRPHHRQPTRETPCE